MPLPEIEGLIRRRLLINFRADPAVVARHVPAPFSPRIWNGCSLVGICLIRLEGVRPRGLPFLPGLASENAAHRVAVEWMGAEGPRQGVFIWRRDTDSRLNHLVGGRVFPGNHHLAQFRVVDTARRIEVSLTTQSPPLNVDVAAEPSAAWPAGSAFSSLPESSAFFAAGSVGYSPAGDCCRFDGLRLETEKWMVEPLEVQRAESSFFADAGCFPNGSVVLDHALLMRDIPHRWVVEPRIAPRLTSPDAEACPGRGNPA